MLFLDFVTWWYGPGWALRVETLFGQMRGMWEYFSIPTLLTTLFSPWRQNISVSRPDQALETKLAAIVDNVVSRAVGFVVRTIVLFVAVIALTLTFVFNVIYTALWPIIPFGPVLITLAGALA